LLIAVLALVRVPIARIKHHDPNQQQTRQNWEERVYFTPHITNPPPREARTGPWQEPEAESREEAAYWLAPHGLLLMACSVCFFIATCLGMDPPTSIINPENVPQSCP